MGRHVSEQLSHDLIGHRQCGDPGVQRAAQAPYHDDPDEFLYFAYPPFVAVIYAALAWMPYGVALSVHAFVALAALAVSLRLVLPRRPGGSSDLDVTIAATAVALIAYPIVTAVLGGQNTTFTMLLFAVVWRSIEAHRVASAGVASGLMLFKPQFGLVLLALLLVARRWTVLLVAGVMGAAIGIATAGIWGWDWVSVWQ